MLINLTNHRFKEWTNEQKESAKKTFGFVQDFYFPNVPYEYDEEEIKELAKKTVDKVVMRYGNDVDILCQGEMGVTFNMVLEFKQRDMNVYHATTSHEYKYRYDKDGKKVKKAIFSFESFRRY